VLTELFRPVKIFMTESLESRLSRYSLTALLVGCSAGGSSFIAGIITGEHNRFMFPGLLVFISTMLLVAGVGALTLKQYPVTHDPKKLYIESIPRERVPVQRWFMVIFCFSAAVFFLVLAGMYYCGEDPLDIPKKQAEETSA